MCCANCVALAIKNDELEEEARQLRAELYGRGWEPPGELRLTRAQSRMLAAMVKHNRPLPEWLLFDASRGEYTSAQELHGHLIHTVICQIRRKLKPFGLEIETVRAAGYHLTATSRQRLLNWPTHTPTARSIEAA